MDKSLNDILPRWLRLFDILFLVILLFFQRPLQEFFSAGIMRDDFEISDLGNGSAWILLVGFLLALPNFFTYPRHNKHTIGNVWKYFGVLVTAFLICVMGSTSIVYFLDTGLGDSDGNVVIIFIIAILTYFILPFVLASRYMKSLKSKRAISNNVRSLLLLPALFFCTAYVSYAFSQLWLMNSGNSMKEWYDMLSLAAMIYIPCYVAPRWFAYGDDPSGNKFVHWLLRFALFFAGVSLNVW